MERILKMVNGVLLLADAVEGPMPQTRFVLKKSLELGLNPIVVVNKIDRPASRTEQVVDEVFDLFVDLGANDTQLDFPIIYTSAKQGISRSTPLGPNNDITPLLDLIIEKVPSHEGDSEAGFQMLVSSMDYDDYVGRIAVGKVNRGCVLVQLSGFRRMVCFMLLLYVRILCFIHWVICIKYFTLCLYAYQAYV